MNKDIKFRGRHIVNKKWIYGDLIHEEWIGGNAIMIKHKKIASSVLEETVGQFTGLHDKNGKEIYEGDILKLHYIKNGLEEIKANVIYSEDYAQYVIKDTGCMSDDYEPLCDYEDLEVIGNIYENPELLKGADNIE